MAEYLPLFKPGDAVTHRADSAVIGGRLVQVAGPRAVEHTDADGLAVGVAAFDAAAGDDVTVYGLSGLVHRLVAAGAITAGAAVSAAADGKVAVDAEAENPIGVALTGGAADSTVQIQGR